MQAPGYLEGGDFFPLGKDLAMVGVGLRSNVEACQQLMDKDVLGTKRLAVVRDDFDKHQVGGAGKECACVGLALFYCVCICVVCMCGICYWLSAVQANICWCAYVYA